MTARRFTASSIARTFGVPVEMIANLADLTEPELGAILERHRASALRILNRANRRPWIFHRLAPWELARIEAHHAMMDNARDEVHRQRENARRILAETAAMVGPRFPVSPKWDRLKPATDMIRTMVHGDVANVARADAVQAYVTEVLADLGIDVRDPLVLYVVLSAAGMVTELAARGRSGPDRRPFDPATHLAIARIVQTLTGSLLPYLPKNAR